MCSRIYINKFLSYFTKLTAVVDQTDIEPSLIALPFSFHTFTEEQQILKMEDQLQEYCWQKGRAHSKAFKHF